VKRHYVLVVDGTCTGIPLGRLEISVMVGACFGYSLTDSATGQMISRQLLVREIMPHPEVPGEVFGGGTA